MTIEKLAEKARKEKGLKITLKKRSDGGYVVKSINGHKFKGVMGNKVLRRITKEELSASQLAQRRGQYYNVTRKGQYKFIESQKTKTKYKSHSKKYEAKVSEDLKKQLKKTQRKWREKKLFEHGLGRHTLNSVKKAINIELEKGKTLEEAQEAVMEKLKRAENYARGLANPGSIDVLIRKLERLKVSLKDNENLINKIEETISQLRSNNLITQKQVNQGIQIIYDDSLSLEAKAIAVYDTIIHNIVIPKYSNDND